MRRNDDDVDVAELTERATELGKLLNDTHAADVRGDEFARVGVLARMRVEPSGRVVFGTTIACLRSSALKHADAATVLLRAAVEEFRMAARDDGVAMLIRAAVAFSSKRDEEAAGGSKHGDDSEDRD